MKYLKIKPCDPLTPFIDSIWIQENDSLPGQSDTRYTTVIPTTMMDLVFHYGDNFSQQQPNTDFILPKIYLTGQKTSPVKVKATGKTGIIIVSFKPWGVSHFFQIPADEFKNSSVALTDIKNFKNINCLEERLTEAHSVKEKVDIVQSFLCDILKKIDFHNLDKLIIEAACSINEHRGAKKIAEIREACFISKRHFIRRFQKVIGSNPKEFSNIVRFQKALLYTKLEVPVEKIINTLGYYDQSHLLREFRKLGGTSRSAIIKNLTSSSLKQAFNTDNNPALFYNTIYL